MCTMTTSVLTLSGVERERDGGGRDDSGLMERVAKA